MTTEAPIEVMRPAAVLVDESLALMEKCAAPGADTLVLARELAGFESWTVVYRFAMSVSNPMAVELLRRLCARADS